MGGASDRGTRGTAEPTEVDAEAMPLAASKILDGYAADESAVAENPASTNPRDESPRRKNVPTQESERLWTPLFLFIIAMNLCCFIVGQGLNSGTSVYLSLSGHATTFAGVLAAVFSFAAAITRIAAGPLVDRRGRWVVIVSGIAVLLAGTALPVFASHPLALVAARVLQGIGFSAATTASATAAADVLPQSRLGEGIGYYGLGQALAMSVGPAFALFLVYTDPAENLYWGLSATAALGIALTFFCRYENSPQRLPATSTYRRRFEQQEHKEVTCGATDSPDVSPVSRPPSPSESDRAKTSETLPQAERDNAPAETKGKPASTAQSQAERKAAPSRPRHQWLDGLFERSALPGALPILVLSPAFGFSIFFAGLYGTTIGVGNAGLFYTLSAVSMVAVRLGSKSFMDRVAPIKVFTVAVLCGLFAFSLLLASPANLPLYYVAGLLYGVCLGIGSPLNQAVAVKNTPPERWGAANALFLLATDIGIGVSCVIWGVVNDLGGFSVTICCVMACIVVSYAVAWKVYPKR